VSLTATNGVSSDTETKLGYVTVTEPGGGGGGSPLTFAPTDDARVSEGSPGSNYADGSTLRVRDTAGSDYRSYLKFQVSGVTPGMSAKLRLYVKASSVDGGSLPIASAGAVKSGRWKEFDLGAVISANGVYSFGLQSNSPMEAQYSSSRGSKPPELVLTP
jgi:hypothetical protein